MNDETCFPEVQYNELIQTKIINSIFDKISECSNEKEVKDKINDLLTEKSKLGLISLESLRDSDDFKDKINLLLECSLTEVNNTIGEEVDVSYIVKGITSFVCNPPTFQFPDININFNFSLKDVFNKILFELIDILVQTIMQILQKILDVVTNLCEGGIENLIQGYESISNILNQGFADSFNLKIDAIQKELEKIFNTFGFQADGNIIRSSNFPECDENLESIKSINNFLNDLSMMLTPNEICLLLEGNPNNLTLDTIKELLNFDYKLLKSRLSDDIIIVDFFAKLGRFVPTKICNDIRQRHQEITDSRFSDVCDTNESTRETIRSRLLRAAGNSDEEIKQLLENERKRYADRFNSLAKFLGNYRKDPNSVFNELQTNIFCKNGKAGSLTLKNFPLIENTAKTVIDTYFATTRSTHFRESQNVQDLFFNKKTQRRKVTRFYSAVPQDKRRIGNIRIENGENVDYKRVQALGNPLYYTDKEEYALVVEKYSPDIILNFTNEISKKIFIYINDYLSRVGDVIVQGQGSDIYEDIFDDRSIEAVSNVYNQIINSEALLRLSEKLYQDYFIGDNAPVYDAYDLNKITQNKIVNYFSNEFNYEDKPNKKEILEEMISYKFEFSDSYYVEIPKPDGTRLKAYQFSNAAGFATNSLDLELILENFFEYGDFIRQNVSEDTLRESDDQYYALSDYGLSSYEVNQLPKREVYTLRQLRVTNTENIDNRWLADINKIMKDNATEEQPIGILEEYQTSNLINYLEETPSFSSQEKIINSLDLKYTSIFNQTNLILPQDNSVLTINELYTDELSNIINSLDVQQIDQVNYLLNKDYNIDNVEKLNKKTLLYETSNFTNGPFRETPESIKRQIKDIVNYKNANTSWQIDAFKRITNLDESKYYENFANILNYLQTNIDLTVDISNKELINLILIIPFEQIIGLKSVKNKCTNDYLNDPCAISEENNLNEPPMLNKYIAVAQIRLLIRTLCLRQELKDLLSLSKINAYNYVHNDDTYIEFLLQVIKQDLRRLSGASTLFYDLVVKYIEESVDLLIETQNTLIDPISNQEIKLDQELSTDFKIRYFIKQEYSQILDKIENLFISTDLNLAKETNRNIIENKILQTIDIPNELKTQYRDVLLEFIYPTSKILSIMKINKIVTVSTKYSQFNSIFTSTLFSLRSNIFTLLTVDPLYKDCFDPFSIEGLDIDSYNLDAIADMIKKFIIQAPIEIIKGLAESFDPNIRIANPIRNAAEFVSKTTLPCLPFSLALLPVGLVPFGFGPPVLPPWGFAYLALDTAQFLLTPKQKALKLKAAKGIGLFNKLEELFEKSEDC